MLLDNIKTSDVVFEALDKFLITECVWGEGKVKLYSSITMSGDLPSIISAVLTETTEKETF